MDQSTTPTQAMNHVERERVQCGFTKTELCKRAEVSRATYFRYLRGRTHGALARLAINRLDHALKVLVAERDAKGSHDA